MKPRASRPELTAARGPQANAPPPAAPSPRAPRFRLLGAPRRGERERLSPLTPRPRGGAAPLTVPYPLSRGPAFLLFRRPTPARRAVFASSGCPPRVDSLVSPRISWFPNRGPSPHPMTPPSLPPPGTAGIRRRRPGPSLLPQSGAQFRDCKNASPGPGTHLIQTVHLLRGVHDLAAPGAVGIHSSGKGWGGDARARARSLSPRSELAEDGDGGCCNYTGGGDGGWS